MFSPVFFASETSATGRLPHQFPGLYDAMFRRSDFGRARPLHSAFDGRETTGSRRQLALSQMS